MKPTKVVLVVEARGLSLAVGQVIDDIQHRCDEEGHGLVPIGTSAALERAFNLRDGQYRISVERIGD